MIQEFENEVPCHIRKAIFALRIVEDIRAILAQGEIGMHAGTIDPNEWLRKERGRVPHGSSYLATDQFVQLDIVRRTNNIRIGKVHFELRGCDLWMIFFVFEAQCTL